MDKSKQVKIPQSIKVGYRDYKLEKWKQTIANAGDAHGQFFAKEGVIGYTEEEKLGESKELNEAFGEKIITSNIKLKNNEINNFSAKEIFSKEKPITDWEKLNTLDC